MPQMTLEQATDLIGRVVENPDGAGHQVATRDLAQACATVLVQNGLLAPSTPVDEVRKPR
jgi:hypothetical protein